MGTITKELENLGYKTARKAPKCLNCEYAFKEIYQDWKNLKKISVKCEQANQAHVGAGGWCKLFRYSSNFI